MERIVHGAGERHDICRNLIRVWVQKYAAGDFDKDAHAADLLQHYQARITALERLVGKQALELEFLIPVRFERASSRDSARRRGRAFALRPQGDDPFRSSSPGIKGAAKSAPRPRTRLCPSLSIPRPERCRIARSTFYDRPAAQDDTAIVEAISGICEEFEFYGWRRVRAELPHRGLILNHKKVGRRMREHDLQSRRRRRYVATTDSDHGQPICPNRAKDLAIDGPDQLWVADITDIAIREGFAPCRGDPRRWVAPSDRLRHQPLDPHAPDAGCAEHGRRAAKAAARVHSPQRPRFAIRRAGLSGGAASPWSRRLDGQTRRPI